MTAYVTRRKGPPSVAELAFQILRKGEAKAKKAAKAEPAEATAKKPATKKGPKK